MKKLFFLWVWLCAVAGLASAQISISVPNDTVTGTTLNKLATFITTAGATSLSVTSTSQTQGADGIVTAGAGTSNVAILTISGVAPCVFDNATTANDFVQISSTVAGDCHDVGSTRPTSGQIVGTVFGAGGSAGTYNISFSKNIYPSAATTPLTAIGSSDTITAAGAFATTISVPSTGLAVGSVIEVEAHGIYTTGATASPQAAFQINAGGTAAMCSGGNINPSANRTNAPWQIKCFIQISTTGAPGTATVWGQELLAGPTGIAVIGPNAMAPGPFNYITNSAQTVSVQETGTPVSGQSFTLQSLFVRVY